MTYEQALARYAQWATVSPGSETVQVIATILDHFRPVVRDVCTWCLQPQTNHDPRCYRYYAESSPRAELPKGLNGDAPHPITSRELFQKAQSEGATVGHEWHSRNSR